MALFVLSISELLFGGCLSPRRMKTHIDSDLMICIRRMRDFNSNQRDVEKLVATFYAINFPNHMVEEDLWNLFQEYGKIADVYITKKLSKTRRRFAFVRFLNIIDENRLESKLSSIWVRSYHLFV